MNKKLWKRSMQVVGFVVIVFMAYFSHKGNKSHSMKFESTFKENTLGVCGEKPNCVSSFHKGSEQHFIQALTVDQNPITKVKEHFQFCSLIKETSHYVQYECKSSMFKFVDDIEVFYHQEDKKLHYRSASRIGHSDLGANRKRIQSLIDSF